MNMLEPLFRVLFSPSLIKIWVLIGVVSTLGLIFRSAFFKGWFGEQMIRFLFWMRLPKDQYTVLHNVTLPTADGTTQIDHIVISTHGVFVVETKNMKGWIFGSERQAMWTQQIYKFKTQFQNPLRQNFKHTDTLKELLGLPDDTIHSLVVFVGGSTFKTEMPDNVTTWGRCANSILKHTDHVLSEEAVREIAGMIQENRLRPGIRTHLQHVRHVKEIIKSKKITQSNKVTSIKPDVFPEEDAPDVQEQIPSSHIEEDHDEEASSPDCPQCGSAMLLRAAKKGANAGQSFWGCSNYPKCRGIRSVEIETTDA